MATIPKVDKWSEQNDLVKSFQKLNSKYYLMS